MRDGKLVVLQVLAGLNLGGAESRIMDITRNLSDTKVSYDFLIHNNEKNFYEDEAKSLGCNIYRVPRFRFFNMIQYKKAMKNFFMAHPEIDIVQGHITSSAAIYLPIAKKCGVKVTIAHARSAGVDKGYKGILTRILRKNLWKKADYMWTCSREAAVSVFGSKAADKALFIPNAIDVSRFDSEEKLRDEKEKIIDRFNLKDKFVVGHIGRFHYAKNHEFLIDIFKEIKNIKPNAVLFLVGDGENRKMIEDKVVSLGLKDSVVFAGAHRNVPPFYRVFDVLVFPSRYEGLPGTIVESQASSLPAVVSDAVTKDMAVTNYVSFVSLNEPPKVWAEKTIELYETNSQKKDVNPAMQLRDNGFDINVLCKKLEKEYIKLTANA